MKILMALHGTTQKELEELVSTYAKMKGHEAIIPQYESKTPENVIRSISETHPDKVLTEINYGSPNSNDITPFQKVEAHMKQLGYDTQTMLLGITGNDELLRKAETQYKLSTSPRDIARVFNFIG